MGIDGINALKPGEAPPKKIRYEDVTDPMSLLIQLAGTASVCWENMSGKGVFREDEARAACEEAFDRLNELIPMQHSDETLQKVWKALSRAGCSPGQAQDAVTNMQNAGIYFREVKQ